MKIFLCGDVMTGRGIDQVLPHPGDPRIHEPYMRSAQGYVELAEAACGHIPKPVGFDYVWGDALEALQRAAPDVRIVNLETAITRSEDREPKGINYRMHPDNVAVITSAGVACCVLANNHVLDWGRAGLRETLDTLHGAGVRTAGAGNDLAEAQAPAVLEVPGKGRVLVFAFGTQSAGVPHGWAAGPDSPGVNLLEDLSQETAQRVASLVREAKRPGDIVIASIHWGGNWGYQIPEEQERFARRLIEEAGVDAIYGHSSHHPKGIAVHQGRPILYGCGDFINDYEGIGGYEDFRGDLALMYLLVVNAGDGRLLRLEMTPFRMRRFRLGRAPRDDARWLTATLDRECGKLGTRVELDDQDRLVLRRRLPN